MLELPVKTIVAKDYGTPTDISLCCWIR